MTTNINNIYLGQKFSPCLQKVDLIEREELLDELEKALDGNITLLSSPAGFGKSCLLSQFHHRLLSSTAITPIWISLDAKDNEPNQFYSLIASALVNHNVVNDSLISAANNLSAQHQEEKIAIQLITALANYRNKSILIFDDFHLITHQRILDFINHLLDFHLPNFHLIISSRVTPKLPLSQFATQGLLTIISSDSLRFSEINSHELLKSVVPKKELLKLIAKAEGWPVALQLIKLWYQQHHTRKETNLVLTGDGQIASYMTEQIVSHLNSDVRQFLLTTSVLDRFNESLADTIREENNSSIIMSSLENLDALVVPIDNKRKWFRYHHLVSDYLRSQLRTKMNYSEIQALHRRASVWYFNNNILSDAILHALKSDNLALAIDHVFKFGGWQMILTKGIGFVESVLHYFDGREIIENSVLALMSCYLNLKLGDVQNARELIELAKCLEHESLSNGKDPQRLIILEQILILYEDSPNIIEIQSIYKKIAVDDFLVKGILEAGIAMSQIRQGQFLAAKQLATEGFLSMKNAGCLVGATYLLFHKGQSLAYIGKILEAKSVFLEAEIYAKSQKVYDSGLATITNCALANLQFELGEFDHARELLDHSFRNIETGDGWFDVYANTFRTTILLSLKNKHFEKTNELLERAKQVAADRNIPKLNSLADVWTIKYLFLLEKNKEANGQIAFVNKNLLDADENKVKDWFAIKEYHTIMCEFYLYKNVSQKCLYHANELFNISQNLSLYLDVTRARIFQCLVYFAEKKERLWQENLEDALAFGSIDRLVSLFTEMPNGLEAVLRRWLRSNEEHKFAAYAGFLLTMLTKEPREKIDNSNFSRRESQILELLCKGFQNKQIASQLNISENTVKFHLKNVFVKLNVSNRLEAITKFMTELN